MSGSETGSEHGSGGGHGGGGAGDLASRTLVLESKRFYLDVKVRIIFLPDETF